MGVSWQKFSIKINEKVSETVIYFICDETFELKENVKSEKKCFNSKTDDLPESQNSQANLKKW